MGFVTVTAYERLYLDMAYSFAELVTPLDYAGFILCKESPMLETRGTDCHAQLNGNLPRNSIRPVTASKSTQGISPK
jgi:hypothetical protein